MNSTKILSKTLIYLLVVFALSSSAAFASAKRLVNYTLSDVRVLYFYESQESIDWPTLFYLNREFGCRIDLVAVEESGFFGESVSSIPDQEIFLHIHSINQKDSLWAKQLLGTLFAKREPELIIFDKLSKEHPLHKVKSALLNHVSTSNSLFKIEKIFEFLSEPKQDKMNKLSVVNINRRELFYKYQEDIENYVPELFPWYNSSSYQFGTLAKYKLVKPGTGISRNQIEFLSGIDRFRLLAFLEDIIPKGPKRKIMQEKGKGFINNFNSFKNYPSDEKINDLIDGFREFSFLFDQYAKSNQDSVSQEFNSYLKRILEKAERATLSAVGLYWGSKIILRDSPHGTKLKFRLELSANSLLKLELKKLSFKPYWESEEIILESSPIHIIPHQSLVKEYLIEIDRKWLESNKPDSLLFIAEIGYRKNEIILKKSIPVWEKPDLQVYFEPDFHFIAPFGSLDIDRIVSSMFLRVLINKPANFSDSIKLSLTTPAGMFAGSYKSDHFLEKGTTRKTIQIPFTISNLFEKGVQLQTISLHVDGRTVALDTGLVRIASAEVDQKIKVGFLPDRSGMLEDILRMTNTGFQPLTNRTLLNYDLDAYDVILVGTGSLTSYPAFREIKGRLESYLRNGGSIVIMGQKEDWIPGLLPVALAPYKEFVTSSEIKNKISEAIILSKPYPISDKNLLSGFYKKIEVRPAIISPAEIVYVTGSGGALLSVSHFGEGQLIYCGLPLLEMISKLDIDAIHLFANILNY